MRKELKYLEERIRDLKVDIAEDSYDLAVTTDKYQVSLLEALLEMNSKEVEVLNSIKSIVSYRLENNGKTYTAGCSFDLDKSGGAITVVDSNGEYRMVHGFESWPEYKAVRNFLKELGVNIVEEITPPNKIYGRY